MSIAYASACNQVNNKMLEKRDADIGRLESVDSIDEQPKVEFIKLRQNWHVSTTATWPRKPE